MAIQRPPAPQPSPIEPLLLAADTFRLLPLDAPKEEVETGFDKVRSLMLDVMMGSLDAHTYKQSWDTLTYYGDAELHTLIAMSVGTNEYSDKFIRIKRLVQSAINCLP